MTNTKNTNCNDSNDLKTKQIENTNNNNLNKKQYTTAAATGSVQQRSIKKLNNTSNLIYSNYTVRSTSVNNLRQFSSNTNTSSDSNSTAINTKAILKSSNASSTHQLNYNSEHLLTTIESPLASSYSSSPSSESATSATVSSSISSNNSFSSYSLSPANNTKLKQDHQILTTNQIKTIKNTTISNNNHCDISKQNTIHNKKVCFKLSF